MTDPNMENLNTRQQIYYELLQTTPRKLGQVNEMNLFLGLGQTITCCILCFLLFIFQLGGMLTGIVDITHLLVPKEAKGVVTYREETNFSVNEEYVWEVGFKFELDGVTYESFSHHTSGIYHKTEEVTVEYSRFNPSLARIKGTNYGMFGAVGTIVIYLILAACLAVCFFWARRSLQWRRLLTIGKVALATLKEKEGTNMSVNEQLVYKLTYSMDTEQGNVSFSVKTHQTDELEDDPYELALYDPDDPTKCYLFDQLPLPLTMKEAGRWEGGRLRILGLFCVLYVVFSLLSILKMAVGF